MEVPVSRRISVLTLVLMLGAVEWAYFAGVFADARLEEIVLYAVFSPISVPMGMLYSAAALGVLSVSLLVRSAGWRSALIVIAIVLQLVLWPEDPKCFGSPRDCQDPLQTYRHFVIFFWIAVGAFHAIFFFGRARESIENDPYVQHVRQHNEDVRIRRNSD